MPDPVLISRHIGFKTGVGAYNPSLEQPLVTATTDGAGYIAQPTIAPVGATIENLKGKSTATSVNDPLPTQTAHAAHLYLAKPTIAVDPIIIPQQRGAGVEFDSLDRPLRTTTTNNGTGIAVPSPDVGKFLDMEYAHVACGKPYIVVSGAMLQLDVTYRMLTDEELSKAMSFTTETETYTFEKTTSTSQRVKMIGNAVAVRTAMAIIEENLSYRFCQQHQSVA